MSAVGYEDDPFLSTPLFLAAADKERPAGPVEVMGGPRFLSDLWDEDLPEVVPTLLPVMGGKPLLYKGESHSVYGEGGSGKTWFGYLAVKQVAAEGGIVLIVDYESNVRTALLRLRSFGVTKEDVSRIAYWSFSDSLMPGTESGKAFAAWVDNHGPTFVLIDSVARALATAGFDENKNQDFNLWDAGVLAKLTAKRVTSLVIDHTGHLPDGRSGPAKAIGASSKANRLSGASYYFDAIAHWTRESNGVARLTCMKDREGHRAKGSIAAEMHVMVHDGGTRLDVELRLPERTAAGKTKLTGYWRGVSKLLSEATEPMSGNKVAQALLEDGMSSAKRLTPGVLKEMETEGYVRHEPGPRGAKMYSLARPYLDNGEPRHEAANVPGF